MEAGEMEAGEMEAGEMEAVEKGSQDRMAMVDIEARIRDAAAKNQELLMVLRETDHAIPDLHQHDRFLADLEAEASASDQRVREIEQGRVREWKVHEKYHASVMRRFLYKVSGKGELFKAKAEQEERVYFHILAEEHRETGANVQLHGQVAEARQRRAELGQAALRHDLAQRGLDSLYQAIFGGPTPSFPEEDVREQASAAALQAYHDTRTRVECEQQAARLLEAAAQRLETAAQELARALAHSRTDMWGGGTMSDMMDRNALHRADATMRQSNGLLAQAQRFSPFVGRLAPVQLNQGRLLAELFFDNIFTDMAFHQQLRRDRREIHRCTAALRDERDAAHRRHAALLDELGDKERQLDECRCALQRVREQAFERVGASGGRAAPAPG